MLFSKKSLAINKKLLYTITISSLIGLLDSVFLTTEHYSGAVVGCNIISGCENVLASSYATMAGLPVAIYGVAFYLSILLSTLIYFDSEKKFFIKVLSYLPILAWAFTLYFLYLQAFIIKSFCQYCLLSALTSTILFVCSIIILKKPKQ